MNTLEIDKAETVIDERTGQCLMLDLAFMQIIVPRVLVAEVISTNSVSIASGIKKDIKIFQWRGTQVPLIGMTAIDPGADQEYETKYEESSKIVLLHGLSDPKKLPYYALPVVGSPKLVMVSMENVSDDQNFGTLLPGESLRVLVEGETCSIPKVDYLEKYTIDNCFR